MFFRSTSLEIYDNTKSNYQIEMFDTFLKIKQLVCFYAMYKYIRWMNPVL